MSDLACYAWDGDDLLIRLKLQPRASRNGFVGLQDDRLRLRITAPPVDGQANRHLLAWLAKQFGVPKSAVTLENGSTSPLKRVRIRRPKSIPPGLPGFRQG